MISLNLPVASVLRFVKSPVFLKLTLDAPITIRENEVAIAEAAFREGYIKPRHISYKDKRVAIIGSGPAGLAAANQLNHMGYHVTVIDKNEAPGGLLRYGIPNFKLSKGIIDRRIQLMKEGKGLNSIKTWK